MILKQYDSWSAVTAFTVANLAWALDSLVALLDGDAMAQGAVQSQLHHGFVAVNRSS